MRSFHGSGSSAIEPDTHAAGTPGTRSRTQQLQRRSAPSSPSPSGQAPSQAGGLERTEPATASDDPFAAHLLGGQVQRAAGPGATTSDPDQVHDLAARGVAGQGAELPHHAAIQRSFGPAHDVGAIEAFVGGEAATAAGSIGAEAYATGHKVGFRSSPDLHTAAHEAAHVVQQRAGVHLRGGVGEEGDPHERHADAVADRVVRGESAAELLGAYHGDGGTSAVQRSVANPGSSAAPAHAQAQAAEPDGPAASGDDTIAGQLAAGGIRIALARQAVDADIAPAAATMLAGGQTLPAVLTSTRNSIGQTRQWRTLNELPPDVRNATLTSDQATQIATAKMHNNREFMNQGVRGARARQAVGGSPSAPQIGQPLPFLRTEDPLAAVEALSVAVRDLAAAPDAAGGAAAGGEHATPHAEAAAAPSSTASSSTPATSTTAANPTASAAPRRRGGHVAPRTQNIAELSIFTHGSPTSIELGSLGWANASTVSGRLSPLLAPNVHINLFACSAASGEDSFAEQLTENLAQDESNPHTAEVFGHTTYGNTATLHLGRRFHADAGDAEASSATNFEAIFTDDFVEEQKVVIAAALAGRADATEDAVGAAIRGDRCGRRWLASALRRATVTMPGRGDREQEIQASFAMGLDPGRARAAVHTLWRQPEEGVAAVRRELDRARR